MDELAWEDWMKNLKNLFLFNKKSERNKDFSPVLIDQYIEIAKLVKEARIQQNLTIKELSYISKIPEKIINSIEDNNKKEVINPITQASLVLYISPEVKFTWLVILHENKKRIANQ